MSGPDDRDDKAANVTVPAAAPSFSDFGKLEIAPESGGPPIPRGKAREVLLSAFANLAHAIGEAEAVSMAIARALDEAAAAADAP
jgi:hypothetical protein